MQCRRCSRTQVARTIECGSVIDLFSGAGGLAMGFEWAGHQLVSAADMNRCPSPLQGTQRWRGRRADRPLQPDQLRTLTDHAHFGELEG